MGCGAGHVLSGPESPRLHWAGLGSLVSSGPPATDLGGEGWPPAQCLPGMEHWRRCTQAPLALLLVLSTV